MKKKALALVLTLLMVLGCVTFSGAEELISPAPVADTYIYVGLFYSNSAVKEATFTSDEGFIIASHSRSGYSEIQDLRYYKTLVARVENGVINLYDANGNSVLDTSVIPSGLGNSTALMSAATEPDSRVITVNGKKYREGVVFGAYAADQGTMAVANYVTLEHYLWGVLNNEMGYENHIEALKTQAVAARSFAISKIGYHGGGALGFDVCTTTHCQVYSGMAGEHLKTTEACQATAGKVISYNGKVATAYYHDNNFGYTMSADEYWGGSNGWCQSVRDPYSKPYEWKTDFTFEELETRLKNRGKSVGTIKSVQVTERYDNGAVKSLLFKGDEGEVLVSGSNITSWFNLRSLGFSMSGNPDPAINKGSSGGMYAKSKTASEVLNSTISVMGASGEVQNIDISAIQIYNGKETTSAPFRITDLSVFTDELVTSGRLYLKGLGNGHCVGMSQSGAQNMAKAGYTYEDILHYYYTDIEICNYTDL
ncbi:MAG: SpoIID/LytB domain-containing protein [Firmicutes bacterium]|nr:SpoIID/LytB domain-containing protein [Bacillota bacterium]